MMTTDAPLLDGVHHIKLPVRDLACSRAWYESRLGYQVTTEFLERGTLTGLVLTHPNGGPMLGLRRDPERAAAAAGFDYFSIGVPSKEALEALAARLTTFGEAHAGVHFATIGWILPATHDPDGHEVRFTPPSTTPRRPTRRLHTSLAQWQPQRDVSRPIIRGFAGRTTRTDS
jgi:catechol 2,3-dioxygenase-like lactoylglutathione lyase family enzyme